MREQIHQKNAQEVPKYSKSINEMHMGASTVFAQAEIARDSANNLFEEVTEAESKSLSVFCVLRLVNCTLKMVLSTF